MPRLDSDFAIVDVKTGRAELADRIKKGERIPITIRGVIDATHSKDDGISIEFSIDDVQAEIE